MAWNLYLEVESSGMSVRARSLARGTNLFTESSFKIELVEKPTFSKDMTCKQGKARSAQIRALKKKYIGRYLLYDSTTKKYIV